MKKTTKKIYSILLIVLMLLNYIPVISRAIEDSVMTLALESTASSYNVGDEILVDLKVSDINGIGAIKQFAADMEYDNTALELTEIVLTEAGYSNTSNISASRIVITKSSGDGTIDVGDTVCTIKFRALKSSDTSTTVKVTNVDATCNSGSAYHVIEDGIEDIDGYVNFPEITLPVQVTQIAHNLKITKTDNSNSAIANNSALFKIIDLSGKTIYAETEADGSLTLAELQMPTTTEPFVYTIQEIVAPTGYVVNENPTTVTVAFAEDGTVSTAVATNGSANIEASTNTIEVAISNELEEVKPEQEVFNIVLNKVNEQNQSITTDTTEFTLTLPDGTTANYATEQATGKTNNIAVIAPETAGTYAYLIKETKTPSGYITEPNNIIVELTFEEQSNKIVLTSANIVSYNNETITPVVEGSTKTLTLNIKNEQEIITYDYSINIDKVKNDTFNTKITEDEAIFEITKDDKTLYVKTNALGKATYEFSMTNKEIAEQAEHTYTIKEIKAPQGYVLDESSKTVTLTFNTDGSIGEMNVTGTNIEKLSSTSNTANVQIINEEEQQEIVLVPEDFTLSINKVDELGNLIIADSANFILTKPDATKQSVVTTNGVTPEIQLTAPSNAGKQVYFLQETKAPEGYEILNESLVLEMNYIESEGKVVLENATINGEVITPVTTSGVKTLTLNVKNAKIQEQKTYGIKINLSNGSNETITEGTTVLKFTNPENNEYFYKEISTLGEVIELNMPDTAKNMVYEIEQIKAPTGYVANNNKMTLSLTFEEDENGEIKVSSYTIEGTDTIKDETAEENIASFTIINEAINAEVNKENYSIEINKVDAETNELIEAESAVFTVISEGLTEKDYATTSGKTLIENLVPGDAGTEKIYAIKEKTAPNGYNKVEENILIRVNFDKVEGKAVANSAELVLGSDNAEVTVEGNVVKIMVKNQKIVEEVEIQKENYSIEINKVDAITNELIEENAIFTVISEGSQTNEYTTENGKILIENLVPGDAQTKITYVIKEKVAPDGYKLPTESIVLAMTFIEENEKIVVSNPKILIGGEFATVELNENVIKVTIENEKSNDLYVISKKNQDQTDIYDVLKSYTGRHYSITSPFIDTRIAKLGGNPTVQEFINNLESNGVLTVWDEEGNQVPTGNRIKTNMILKANKNDQEMTFTIVVKGDIDGDGRVRTKDVEALEKHVAGEEGKIITNPISLRAADIGTKTGDGIDGLVRGIDINNLYNVLAQK